tara:strand:- start:113 stop:763 length:651 start_codon:yes stop_codon:yes gene_type:complete
LKLNVKCIVTGPFKENSYLISYNYSSYCIIIDPGDNPDSIIDEINRNNYRPIAIVNTHAHLDHIGGVNKIQTKYKIPFYLHQNEKIILDNYTKDCEYFGISANIPPIVDHWFNSGKLELKEFSIKLLETPGHTPGGTCLVIEKHVFTGDTIFCGSVGRTDLPGGNWDTLCDSLVSLMNNVPFDYILHPGHGPRTSLSKEISQNQFLIPLLNKVNFS